MDEQKQLIDINQATLDELITVPGIGPALAKRILLARPFVKLDDLLKVRGINPQQLIKWIPALTVQNHQEMSEPAVIPILDPAVEADAQQEDNPSTHLTSTMVEPPEDGLPEKDGEEPAAPVEPAPHQQVDVEEASPAGVQEKLRKLADEIPQNLHRTWDQSRPLTQVEAMVWGGAGALVVLILGIILSLGMLAGVNGGLSYVSSSRYAELQSQMTVLIMQTKQLQQDTGSLQERMNSLEGLSGRVSTVEKANAVLKAQIGANAKDIQSLVAQTKQIEDKITALQDRSQAYDKFFEG